MAAGSFGDAPVTCRRDWRHCGADSGIVYARRGQTETISTEELCPIMQRNLIAPSTTCDAMVAKLDLSTRELTDGLPITGGEVNPALPRSRPIPWVWAPIF